MGLSKKGQPLEVVFLKYLISVGVGLIFAITLSFIVFACFLKLNLIEPANYTESQILNNKTKIETYENFDDSLIPSDARYVFLSEEGKIIKTNMREESIKKAIDFHDRKEVSTSSSSFMEIKRKDGYVVINYRIRAHYTNAWIEKYSPKVDHLFASLLVLFCLANSLLITLIWGRKIKIQLSPMIEVSEKIAKNELDFKIKSSNIKEFNEVLNGLDRMRIALTDSLKENWTQQENKISQISALTHDLKTPISIVMGNGELLRDTDLTSEQKDYVEFIIKNSNRILEYTNDLMDMIKSNKSDDLYLKKIKVSDFVDRICEIARGITLVNSRNISLELCYEESLVNIDINLFDRVINNVLSNAIQYSPKNSSIELKFFTENKRLLIYVINSGSEFSKEDIVRGTEEFYRGDKSRHSSTNYGLGLYISSRILEIHGGKITLENDKNGGGAKVELEIQLL